MNNLLIFQSFLHYLSSLTVLASLSLCITKKRSFHVAIDVKCF